MGTRPDLICGINNKFPASVGNGTNAMGQVAWEEQSSGTAGSGSGWGQRQASRDYENFPADVFKPGSAVLTQFNGGRVVVNSVSGGYSMASDAAGTHDAEWNAMFDRMFNLDFGGTDTSGTGTKKPLLAPLCLYHEVDVPKHNVPAADFVAAFKHIRVLRNNRAAAAGVNPLRVPLMTIFTAYGIDIGRATPYWPGNDQVDLFGVDGYNGLGSNSWREASSVFASSLAWSAAHGDKDVWICETSTKEISGHSTTTWWNNFATYVASKPKIKAILTFQSAPGDTAWGFDKVMNAAKHEAMRQFILTTGATAGYGAAGGGGGTQLPPGGPTGVTFTSDPSGTFGTLTWAANPSADNVTLWDVYAAPGKVTSGFVKQNVSSLPAAPRSYRVTGLTPGSSYTFTVVAINSAGRSGFGNMFQGVTSKPGPTNQAPVILGFSADVDGTDPTLVHFTSSASDPNGDALTSTIAITGPNAFTQTLTGPNVDANFDSGAYLAALNVTDGLLTTTQVVPFKIAVLPIVTPDSGYVLPQPGDDLRDITLLYRQTIPDLDMRVTHAYLSRSSHNTVHNFVGSTFDPAVANTTKTAWAAQDLRWYPMKLEDSTITGLSMYVTDAQAGSGTKFCLHAADGSQLCDVQSGTTVDSALQTVGDTEIDLDAQVTGRTPGEVVIVGFLFPAGVTPPKTYLALALPLMGQIRTTAGLARGNLLTGQATYPDVLPLASATAVSPAFVALY